MLTAAKFALIAALVVAAASQASAATRSSAMPGGQAAAYDVIPGYGKDGGRTAVPNPDR